MDGTPNVCIRKAPGSHRNLFDNVTSLFRGRTNRVFGKPCFCPLPKRGRFDENGENDEFAFYPLKTRVWLLRPPKTTKMTKMAGVTQEKAWFRKGRVCSSLTISRCGYVIGVAVPPYFRVLLKLLLSAINCYYRAGLKRVFRKEGYSHLLASTLSLRAAGTSNRTVTQMQHPTPC